MLIFVILSVVASDTDGPWSLLGRSGYSGMVTINNSTGSALFYWLFEAQNGDINKDRNPLIMWLQGGPGRPGEEGMFDEYIGPFGINSSVEPYLNNLTWTAKYHVISVDFPLNTGFSFSNSESDLKNSTVGATSYLYTFLVRLATKNPNWFNRDFYVFAESYGGGHWAPGICYKILQENAIVSQTGNPYIKLKGMSIGDPWLDPTSQVSTYATFAYNLGLLNQAQFQQITSTQTQIIENVQQNNYQEAWNYWNLTRSLLVQYSGVNLYNMRMYQPYPEQLWYNWVNKTSTRELLHAPLHTKYHTSNAEVHSSFDQDSMNSTIWMLPYIIENIKVMIYNGQDDLLINEPGTQALLKGIAWKNMKKMLESRKIVWKVNGSIAGYAQQYLEFRFVNVLKAGHQAPSDQPVNIRDLVYRFIQGTPWLD